MLVLWLLLLLLPLPVSPGGPVLPPDRPEESSLPAPSFHRLPVFLHASMPLVPQEMFRPAESSGRLPGGLTGLLLPPLQPQLGAPGGAARSVEAWCGADDVSVRVDRLLLRAWREPSLFRVGSCAPSAITDRFLYFRFGMLECGAQVQVIGGQLVYSYLLSYSPPSEGYVIRASPINLPIHCYYNRFHYSYKVGFRPQVQHTTFLKSIKSKLTFSLTVCNAQWEPLAAGHTFYLGEQVYFLARAAALLAGERLYVDSCYATSSEDPSSMPRVDVITNYGCMADSQRVGSSSQFLSGGGSVVKFSLDAFVFRGVSQVQYLHCTVSVGLSASSIAKSCNFNSAAGRWEEVTSSPGVCSCCDSLCSDTDMSVKSHISSPGWLVEPNLQTPTARLRSFKPEGGEHLGQKLLNKDDVEKEVSQTGSHHKSGFKGEKSEDWKQVEDLEWEKEEEEEEELKEKEVKAMKDKDDDLKTLLTHVMSDEARPLNETGPATGAGPDVRNAEAGSFVGYRSSEGSNYGSATRTNNSSGTDYNPSSRGSSAVDGAGQPVHSESQDGKDVNNEEHGPVHRSVDGNSSVTSSGKDSELVNRSATDSMSSDGLSGDVDLQTSEFTSGSTDPERPQSESTGGGNGRDSADRPAPPGTDSVSVRSEQSPELRPRPATGVDAAAEAVPEWVGQHLASVVKDMTLVVQD